MFNVKVYTRNNLFKYTLSENEISCSYSFSATKWSWLSTLKFDYYWDYEISHKDIIKIYREWKIIYQWYVSWIDYISDKSWEKRSINLNWMIWLLAYKPWNDWTYNNDPWAQIRNIFSSVSSLFNTSNIQNYWTTFSIQTSKETSLNFLQNVLKNTNNYCLFVKANNEVMFWPYENEHILTYWKEVYWIEVDEDSSDYYNKVRVYYSWWYVDKSNQAEIEQYWEYSLVVNDTSLKTTATANARATSLLKEKKISIKIKIKINSEYDYYSIIPWDKITIKNSKRNIQWKNVEQINYTKEWATISLESYKSLESFIINLK